MSLTDRDKAILDFERTWFSRSGPKEASILDHFDVSASRYYQILAELLEDPKAMRYDPLVIRRLRRMRDSRRRARFERRSVNEQPAR
ncbi:MAG: DUF3263 domain-containing protein [Acidimicrobiales bacterium]